MRIAGGFLGVKALKSNDGTRTLKELISSKGTAHNSRDFQLYARN
ncbi:hypothetical protein BSBH6_02175 [Bacillus subtilis]|nr:hypothetical protein BSBH6_02175 [Bacillus subtilis]RPK25103.1 hypothetical protein BH5_01934 [Bacillus subtilis]